MKLLVENGAVITPFDVIENGFVSVQDKKIRGLGPKKNTPKQKADIVVNAEENIVCPGFIDLQVNGGGGIMATDATCYGDLLNMTNAHLKFGTTSMLPTIITAPKTKIRAALSVVGEAIAQCSEGCTIIGSHLEGPFLNKEKRGFHDEKYIVKPSTEDFKSFWEASNGTIRMLTIAPEIDGALQLIKYAAQLNVTISVGHSKASCSQVYDAANAGLTSATHVPNAMGELSAREPGTVGGVLSNDKIFAGLIADGLHVHPKSMKILIAAKGYEKVFLVTDAMSPVGTDTKCFKANDQELKIRNGICYSNDNTIGGSILTMNEAVRIVHEDVGIPLEHSISMATYVPARNIGISGKKGSLSIGKDADIVICDFHMNVLMVIASGKIVFDHLCNTSSCYRKVSGIAEQENGEKRNGI
jgi:N-acetylglucosamine-6-phosphate deacetylase